MIRTKEDVRQYLLSWLDAQPSSEMSVREAAIEIIRYHHRMGYSGPGDALVAVLAEFIDTLPENPQ